MSQRQILNAAGANASSEWIRMNEHKALLHVSGTFSAQTVTIETQSPDGEAIAVEDGALTQATAKILELSRGALFRLTVSNGGTPAINAYVTDQDG